jgi:folate-binding protein YgfZ
MKTNRITSLPQYGVLEISGPDAPSFLQGQVTCHIEELPVNRVQLGGHCNIKGRLQSLFFIVSLPEQEIPTFYLIMPREMIPYALKSFKKYALFSKVNFIDQSDTLRIKGVFGDFSGENTPHWQWLGMPLRWISFYDINQEKLPDLSQEWDLADTEMGLPMVYAETIDKFLPHHLNCVEWEGVSFNKGCYLGQEIVARMHYKGNIKKHLYKKRVPLSVPLKPGIEFENGIIVRSIPFENNQLILTVMDDSTAEINGYLPSKNA